jgi:hypothetical protein
LRLLARITTSAAFLVLASGLFGQAIFRGQNVSAAAPVGFAPIGATSLETGSPGTTPAIDTTGANLIVLVLRRYVGIATGVSDSKSNTWLPLTAQQGGNGILQIYYCAPCIVGTLHTFTSVGFNINTNLEVEAWSGAASSSPFDVQNGTSAGTCAVSSGSITASTPNSLIISAAQADGGGCGTWSVTAGFTISNQGPAAYCGGMAHLVQVGMPAVNPSWNFVGCSGVGTSSVIAAFKP